MRKRRNIIINNINYGDENHNDKRNELNHWIDMIGIDKYYKFYDIIDLDNDNSFSSLKECAVYDFRLSTLLFSLLKHYECYLRANLVGENGLIPIEKKDYKDTVSSILSIKKKSLCSWPQHLKKNYVFFSDFIGALTFGSIYKIYESILKIKVGDFNIRPDINVVKKIKDFRNEVYHHNVLISDDPSKMDDLYENITLLLKHLPSRELKDKYIELINDLIENKQKKYHIFLEKNHKVIIYST